MGCAGCVSEAAGAVVIWGHQSELEIVCKMFVEQARLFVDFCFFFYPSRVRQADLSPWLVYHHACPAPDARQKNPSSHHTVCTYTDRVP